MNLRSPTRFRKVFAAGGHRGKAQIVRPHATQAVVDSSQFEAYAVQLQSSIISQAEALESRLNHSEDSKTFLIDRWERSSSDANAGYGITAVLEGGTVLEKAAANISVVRGTLSPQRAQAMSSRGRDSIDPNGGQAYSAIAMSLVFHSAHPYIPTLRADVRLFEVAGNAWFGGGCDLTPNYLTHVAATGEKTDLSTDIKGYHSFWKKLCDQHDTSLYRSYKDWCDQYFYIPCRKEHRGTGGIFFDDLDASTATFDAEVFTREVGDSILPSWLPIAEQRAGLEFTEEARKWQQLRRGRYIEFNLLYDRGVKFGLDGGRIESIMVSAPPTVQWQYMQSVQPGEGSAEEDMLRVLRQPQEWV